VTPGDQLRIEVNVLSFRPRAGRIEGKAYVDGKLACEATLTCRVVPRVREAHPDATEGQPEAAVQVVPQEAVTTE
jgi:3-hydroxyacyl-[acyl-carrier-protein] dehydratase